MKSSTEGSSFCTLGGMGMTANFNMNMPIINHEHAIISGSNQILDTSANTTDANNTNDNHNMSHDDHNSMNHSDHSSHSHSHSMPTMSQGTVMYMDGFHSALFHNSHNPPPCLNFLYPSVRFCETIL